VGDGGAEGRKGAGDENCPHVPHQEGLLSFILDKPTRLHMICQE
jgi:hypothetical protein